MQHGLKASPNLAGSVHGFVGRLHKQTITDNRLAARFRRKPTDTVCHIRQTQRQNRCVVGAEAQWLSVFWAFWNHALVFYINCVDVDIPRAISCLSFSWCPTSRHVSEDTDEVSSADSSERSLSCIFNVRLRYDVRKSCRTTGNWQNHCTRIGVPSVKCYNKKTRWRRQLPDNAQQCTEGYRWIQSNTGATVLCRRYRRDTYSRAQLSSAPILRVPLL